MAVAGPATTRWVAVPWLTSTGRALEVSEGAVALTVREPAVLRVTLKVPTPVVRVPEAGTETNATSELPMVTVPA